MSWTAPRTYIIGETVTAAILNTDVRDNLLATSVAVSAAQGDIMYATAANALTRLAKGTGYQRLRMNSGATAPEWASDLPALDVVTAETTVASTVTETNLLSYSLPANTLGTDSLLKITALLTFLNNTGAGVTEVVKFKYGGTTLLTFTFTVSSSATRRYGDMRIYLKGDGATNAQEGMGQFVASLEDGTVNSTHWTGLSSPRGTAAIDSTLAQTILLTITHGTSSANMSVTITGSTIALFNTI